MTPAQRAVVAAAKKDGMSPIEVSAEFVCHGMMEALLGQLRKREIAFPKLGEKEQDAAIAEMQAELKKVAFEAARMIVANGCESVAAKMKSLKIDGKLTATMVIEGDEPNRHVLTDKAHDKSGILIVLYPNDFEAGLSEFQGERDQKALPLDEETPKSKAKPKPAKADPKPVELPPKLVEDGRAFILKQQSPNIAALQNFLKIGMPKAEALLKLYEGEGLIKFEGDDASGQYVMVRSKPAEATHAGVLDALAAEASEGAPETRFHELEEGDSQPITILTDALYQKIKDKVVQEGHYSPGALSVVFDLNEEILEQATDRLELEGILTEENEMGLRSMVGELE